MQGWGKAINMAHRGAWGLDTRPEAGCPEISWGWGVRLLPTESGSFHPRYRGRITGGACQAYPHPRLGHRDIT